MKTIQKTQKSPFLDQLKALAAICFIGGATMGSVEAQEGPTYEGLLKLNNGADRKAEKSSPWRSFSNKSDASASSGLNSITGFLFGQDVPAGSTVYGGKDLVAPAEEGGLYAQVEAVWVRPKLDNQRALNAEIGPPRDVNFSYDRDLSTRFELGFLKPAGSLGFRARIWQFSESTSPIFATDDNGLITNDAIVILAGGGLEDVDTVTVFHDIELDVVDLEATKSLGGGLLQSFGLRFANMEQNYQAASDEGLLLSNLDFIGAGPTVSVEGGIPIGQSNFSLFGSARASALVGEQSLKSNNFAGDVNNGDPINDQDTEVIFNTDLKAGVEWRPVSLQKYNFYTRAGVEYQLWLDAGNLRDVSDPTLDDNFDPGTISTLGNYGGDVSFFGFTWSAGFVY